MNKKTASVFSVLIILIFIGYIIFDTISPQQIKQSDQPSVSTKTVEDKWVISNTFDSGTDSLKAVSISSSGYIYLGGDSWVGCFDINMKQVWNLKTVKPVTALSVSGDTIYASTIESIFVINSEGKLLDEWGPFEDNAIITSIASNRSIVTFADAGNKMVVILNKKGEVIRLIGNSGEEFIVPSPYFDLALTEDNGLYVANTGYRRIETRNIKGELISSFGNPGTAPDAFSGCCNPAHFTVIPGGFVTAEKGINRIKILDENGNFVEFVSSVNKFTPSIPLDIASFDGKIIYAVNPADGKLYVFTRK
jgi:hypothetical protein